MKLITTKNLGTICDSIGATLSHKFFQNGTKFEDLPCSIGFHVRLHITTLNITTHSLNKL